MDARKINHGHRKLGTTVLHRFSTKTLYFDGFHVFSYTVLYFLDESWNLVSFTKKNDEFAYLDGATKTKP